MRSPTEAWCATATLHWTPYSNEPMTLRIHRTFALCAILILLVLVRPQRLVAQKSSYTVTMNDEDRRLAIVEARIETRDSVLTFYPDNYDSSHLADGWATFVREFSARDGAGRSITLPRAGRNQWAIPTGTLRPISLHYQLLVHHDQGYWPNGHDESAYAKRDCDCVFFTGMALFIGARDLRDIGVTFVLPGPHRVGGEPWRSVTPWEPGLSPNNYVAADFEDLSENCFVLGRLPTAEVKSGAALVTIAAGRGLPGSLPLFQHSVEASMNWATRTFGAGAEGRFVAIANPDSYDGGGAFTHSTSMLFLHPPSLKNRVEWGHIVAHEMIHLWNGRGIRFDPSEEWFKEGVTDYLSFKALLATGQLTEDQFLHRIGASYGYYTEVAGQRLSLSAAGRNKSENSTLVYNGGEIFAMALDIELRKRTDGRCGIEDLMSALYTPRHGSRTAVTSREIISAANAVAAADVSRLFAQYANGTEVIPLADVVGAAGLDVTKNSAASDPAHRYVVKRSRGASAERLRIRRALLARVIPSAR